MNRQPVKYLQTDPRWKSLPYRVKGETATIGGSGCGPTSAAMAIETLTGRTFTPVDACKWSVDHNYKALNAGTYYGYFVPQFRAFGIECRQMLSGSLHNQPDHPIHDRVKEYIKDGCWAIALMGPKGKDKNGNNIRGTWTGGGHYILVWDWNDKVRINDSASTAAKRLNGDPATFKREVKQYWLIDARDYNKEDDWMDNFEKWKEYMERYRAELAAQDAAPYAAPYIEKCIDAGVVVNAGRDSAPEMSRPGDFLTRQEAAVMQALTLEAAKKG